MCLPLRQISNLSVANYAWTVISSGIAIGVSSVGCLTAILFILALKLYTKLVYRVMLYQVLSFILLWISWEVYLAAKYKVSPLEKYVLATLCVFFVYTHQLLSTWIVVHFFTLVVCHKNLNKLEPLYLGSSVLMALLNATLSLALLFTADTDAKSERCVAFQIFLLKNWIDLAMWCASVAANMVSVMIIGAVLCIRACRRRNGYWSLSQQQHKKALCEMLPLLMFPMSAVFAPVLFKVLNSSDHLPSYWSRFVAPAVTLSMVIALLSSVFSHLGMVAYLKWRNASKRKSVLSINDDSKETARESSHIVVRSTTYCSMHEEV